MSKNVRNSIIAAVALVLIVAAVWWYRSGGYLDNLFESVFGAEAEDVLGGE